MQLLQVQNTRAAELKVEMCESVWGFQTWLSALLSFPPSCPLLCSLCVSVHDVSVLHRIPLKISQQIQGLGSRKAFCSMEFFRYSGLCSEFAGVLTVWPVNLWISCFVFFLSLHCSSVSGPGRGRFLSPGSADSPTLEVSLHSHICHSHLHLLVNGCL